MPQFEVGDWVRLQNNCDMHPSKLRENPPREFIGIYEGSYRVNWLSGELPVHCEPQLGSKWTLVPGAIPTRAEGGRSRLNGGDGS